MDDLFAKEPGVTTRYFDWEGDACRVHREPDGDLTADLYRAGKGLLETNPTSVMQSSREIGEAEYKENILQAIMLEKRRAQG